MGREAATKALLDAGITYDKVQQVRNSFFCSHAPSLTGSHIYSSVPPAPFRSMKANSKHLHDYFFSFHRLLSDTAMVIPPAVSAPCTSSECTR